MNGTYFSLIPSGVMENEKISDASKLTYALILGLSNRYGYCFATNQSLADMRRTSESSMKRHIKDLIDNGLITAEYNKRNDRRLTPNIMPTNREKLVKNAKNVQFAYVDDNTDNVLDDIWRAMK